MKKQRQQHIFTSRGAGFWIIFWIYIVATGIGVFTFLLTNPEWPMLWRLFCADFAATIFVWLGSAVFKNSSVYDPYWSVAPVILLTILAVYWHAVSLPALLMLTAIWVWGIRLTLNWAITFRCLSVQDWRYDKYKQEFPVIWQLVNFTGIHLMPTIIVFLAMIPAVYLLQYSFTANAWTFVAFFLCLFAAFLQLVSDTQMHRFRHECPGQVCNRGVWRFSRHPNYLGEILMWWGIFGILYSVGGSTYLWTATGAFVNTILFVFISIPLMEKRQLKNKPAYEMYRKQTGMLFPKFTQK
ncbi:MAG: DUF1295 domain-containing protein [Tannerellaceae bacterium]|nr:DUF1295 domain-containing protein [Tannerellaceae bacterium]